MFPYFASAPFIYNKIPVLFKDTKGYRNVAVYFLRCHVCLPVIQASLKRRGKTFLPPAGMTGFSSPKRLTLSGHDQRASKRSDSVIILIAVGGVLPQWVYKMVFMNLNRNSFNKKKYASCKLRGFPCNTFVQDLFSFKLIKQFIDRTK